MKRFLCLNEEHMRLVSFSRMDDVRIGPGFLMEDTGTIIDLTPSISRALST